MKYRSEEAPIIILRHEESESAHLFTLEDNGIGVKAGNAEKMFGLYEQPDCAIEGYGIGLSLCRKIIEQHKGKIWVDTDYKFGCRICFTLPKNSVQP